MPRIKISQRSKVHYPDPALTEFLGLGIHHRAYVQDKLQFPGRQAVPGFHELVLLPDIGVSIRLLNPEQFQLHILNLWRLFLGHLAMMTRKITKVNGMLEFSLAKGKQKQRRPVLVVILFYSLYTTLRFVPPKVWHPK